MEDEAQARILLDEARVRFFRPFLARERTVTEAAEEVGCKPSVMLYRVGTLLRAGLLRVVRERKRAGRPVKVYRSVYDAYFVPYALTPFATLEEAFYSVQEANAHRLARLTARRFRDRKWDGYRLFRDASGEAWLEGAPERETVWDLDDPERHLGLDYTTDVHLTAEEARALQAQLVAILRRHGSGTARPGRPAYLLSVAFQPVDEPDVS